MSNNNYECIELQWDTDYFKVRSARVNLKGAVNEVNQEEIIKLCKNYDFITISNFNNIKENNYWIGKKTKAFLVDINIQFSKTIADINNHEKDDTYIVSSLSKNEEIINIAKKSFRFSRFYNDPNLLKMQAENIYLHWTECAFGKENKHFVVSKRQGKIVGYILFSIDKESSTIELIAVDNKYQGQGIGKSLINKMESFSLSQGVNKIKVGTQIDNVTASQFYTSIGFRYVSCSSLYHLWSNN